MNKGILLFSLVLSFSAFGQDVLKQRIIKKLCGEITGNTNNYSNENVRDMADGGKCYEVTCKAETIKDGETHTTHHRREKCLSKSEIDTLILANVNANTNVNVNTDPGAITLSEAQIISLCKAGDCPDGYNLNTSTGVITGPGGFSVTINLGDTPRGSTTGDSDIGIDGSTSGPIISMDGRCPSVGCWYQGQKVSFDGLLNSCFKKLKIKKIGKFLGIFNKKNTGKYRIKYKVLKGCEGAYSAVVDDLTGAISITGSGKGHVGTSKGSKANVKYVYVDKGGKGKGQTQDQSSKGKGQVVLDGSVDGDLVIIGEEGKGSGSLKFVFKNGEKCTYTTSWKECLDSEYDKIVSINGDILHCINCEGSNRRRGRSGSALGDYGRSAGGIINGIGNLFGSVAPGLFGWLSSKEYAGAAKYGFEQCRGMQNDYQTNAYAYIQNNEVPDRDVTVPGCNGYQMGGFAGGLGFQSNGYGGFGNPWTSGGYTGGFIGGMAGPYGQFNPYGNQYGNQYGGLNGGLGIGISGLGGLFNGGVNNGWGTGNGGWTGTPGYGGGIYGNTGFGNGTVPWGNNGGGTYWNGGINGGVNGGINGGLNNGWGQNGQNWGAINQSYQSNQQAAAQGAFYQQQALAGQVQNAGQNYYQYGANSNYGYSPGYAPSNLGLNLNLNGGLGLGW